MQEASRRPDSSPRSHPLDELRVVLDVTSSVVWSGPPVGIVRTVRKFAAFLLDRPDLTTLCCRYDGGRGTYVEVAPSDALGRPDAESRAPAVPAAVGTPRREDGMRADAALLARSALLVLKSSYWLLRGAWRSLRGRRLPGGPEVRFRPRDVYVSMGVDWQHNDLRVLRRLKRTCGFRTVLYCHDLIPVVLPHLTSAEARPPAREYFTDLAHAADHVVAVSRATRDELGRFLREAGAPVPEISVIHPGADFDAAARRTAAPPREDLARTPFVLCVATIEVRKNHELLYHVWDRLVAKHGDRVPLLVLVGMVGWGVHDLLGRLRANARVAGRTVLLGAVPDHELVWLYEHCLFSVYPSFAEGWGLPVAESLALGTPCLTSDAPAVVEAASGLAPALDPLDFPAWLAEIERLAFDPAAREAAARRVRDYRPPTWREHGEAILDVVRRPPSSDEAGRSLALPAEF